MVVVFFIVSLILFGTIFFWAPNVKVKLKNATTDWLTPECIERWCRLNGKKFIFSFKERTYFIQRMTLWNYICLIIHLQKECVKHMVTMSWDFTDPTVFFKNSSDGLKHDMFLKLE